MQARRRLFNAGIAAGVVMMLTPFAVTAFALRSAFATLGASGIGDPHALSRAMAGMLASTAAGFVLVPLGLGVVVFCVVMKRHRFPVPSTPPPLPQTAP